MHLQLLLGTLFSCILCASNALGTSTSVSPTEASGSGLQPNTGLEGKADLHDPNPDIDNSAGSGTNPPGPANDKLTDPLENPDLFEGDLKIPEELIEKFYGKQNETEMHDRTTRAARRNRNFLWPNAIVYYTFHSSITSTTRATISRAINGWKARTCLRFLVRSSEYDYIEFTAHNNDQRCYSTYLGKKGGKQQIQLGPHCRTEGIVMHEIGHAIGLWHEQSRPDRDRYVQIVSANIAGYDVYRSIQRQFQPRSTSEVHHYGSSYDYDSIMHYRGTAFGQGRTTIEVTNATEYARQASPPLGQRTHLSNRDTQQVSRIYNCPGTGIVDLGNLEVYIQYAQNLPATVDDWFDNLDPYVRITAYDDRRNSTTMSTEDIQGTENPTWNQWLHFGTRQWQYFDVSVWDKDLRGGDDRMTETQSFFITPGYHSSLKHCGDESCSTYMYFAYNLTVDSTFIP